MADEVVEETGFSGLAETSVQNTATEKMVAAPASGFEASSDLNSPIKDSSENRHGNGCDVITSTPAQPLPSLVVVVEPEYVALPLPEEQVDQLVTKPQPEQEEMQLEQEQLQLEQNTSPNNEESIVVVTRPSSAEDQQQESGATVTLIIATTEGGQSPPVSGITGSVVDNRNVLEMKEDSQTEIIEKNKEIVEEFSNGQQVQLHQDRVISEMPESEEGWRTYYEHPLSAATTAMMNVNNNGSANQNQNEQDQNNAAVGLFYELYKLPPMEKGIDKALAEKIYGQDIWSTAVTSPNGARVVTSTSIPSSVSSDRDNPSTVVSSLIVGGALKPVITTASTADLVAAAASSEVVPGETARSSTVVLETPGGGREIPNNNNQEDNNEHDARVLTQSDVDLYLNRAAAAAAKRDQIELRQRLARQQSDNVGNTHTRESPPCVVIVNPDSPQQIHHARQQHEVVNLNGIGSAVIIAPGGVISTQVASSPHSQAQVVVGASGNVSPIGDPSEIQNNHHHHLTNNQIGVLVIKQESTPSPLNGSSSRLPSPCSPNSGVLAPTPPAQDQNINAVKSEALLISSPCHTPVDLVAVTAPLAPTAVAVTGSPISGPLGSPDSGKSNDMNGNGSQGSTVISLSAAAAQPFPTQVFANISSQATYETLGMAQYGVLSNAVAVAAAGAPPQYGAQTTSTTSSRTAPSSVYTLTPSDYYREYYSPSTTPTDQYQTVRQHLATYGDGGGNDSSAFVDQYMRRTGGTSYKTGIQGLSVDLPSPDSGIGEATITPRDNAGLPQIFDYSELSQNTQIALQSGAGEQQQATPGNRTPTSQGARRSWHEFGRNSESDKVQIPKLHSDVGFKYFLESPISTSQRREDDRITYINKGQFYGITLEYLPDPEKSLKSPTVKSVVMLVFREEKTTEEEIKAWQFWHSRQHSVKQRILDADTKNSSGIIGQIEEVTHNAIAFYWNPLESQAKINIAVQCLSTDFSNQKGVKGLPLHLQIDTFDDYRDGSTPVHRGYCQIKVFCDKGAERKTRDEERRAAKRKLTATGSGRKKMEEMYHPPMDRSEFYSMSDLQKPPILFTPSEDLEKMAGMELSFYNQAAATPTTPEENGLEQRREKQLDSSANSIDLSFAQPPTKRLKTYPNDRVLLYAKRDSEDVFHALHLVPPTLAGLANAIESKYDIGTNSIRSIYKRCSKGITVQMDDDIVKHYCNEDTFIIEIIKTEEDLYDITLVEL